VLVGEAAIGFSVAFCSMAAGAANELASATGGPSIIVAGVAADSCATGCGAASSATDLFVTVACASADVVTATSFGFTAAICSNGAVAVDPEYNINRMMNTITPAVIAVATPGQNQRGQVLSTGTAGATGPAIVASAVEADAAAALRSAPGRKSAGGCFQVSVGAVMFHFATVSVNGSAAAGALTTTCGAAEVGAGGGLVGAMFESGAGGGVMAGTLAGGIAAERAVATVTPTPMLEIVGSLADGVISHPDGASIRIMPLHFGHERISPIAAGLVTRRLRRQVVH
jgi:hypothetical protein